MTKELLNHFRNEYFKAYGANYPVSWGKDMATIKRLLTYYNPKTLEQYITAFFQLDNTFITKAGHKLTLIQSQIPEIQALLKKKAMEKVTKTSDADRIAAVANKLGTNGDF